MTIEIDVHTSTPKWVSETVDTHDGEKEVKVKYAIVSLTIDAKAYEHVPVLFYKYGISLYVIITCTNVKRLIAVMSPMRMRGWVFTIKSSQSGDALFYSD